MPDRESKFILAVLSLMAEYDCYDAIWWRCDGEYAPVMFLVNCNDLFWWATADTEQLTPEELPALRQAIAEVCEIDKRDAGIGFDLWCARKRGMRPQQPAYPKNVQLQVLFDMCGPPREE